MKKGVLFVCLGNICRSPMAEIVFKHMVKEKGLEDKWFSDSAGTSAYHIGERPDHRTLDICQQRLKDSYKDHRGRQIAKSDFETFQCIENLKNVKKIRPANSTAVVQLIGEYDPLGKRIVEDPYYGGADGFATNFEQVTRACEAFLKQNHF